MVKKRKKGSIEPLYVKNEKGKKLNVYLDIDAYEAIIKRVKEFEKIKEKEKKQKRVRGSRKMKKC